MALGAWGEWEGRKVKVGGGLHFGGDGLEGRAWSL